MQKSPLEQSLPLLLQLMEVLQPWSLVISEEERAAFLHPPNSVFRVLPAMIHALENHPEKANFSKFDAEETLEHLQQAEDLMVLLNQLEELRQRLTDARLARLDLVWKSSLYLYNRAKRWEEEDPSYRTITEPMNQMFLARQKKAPEKE